MRCRRVPRGFTLIELVIASFIAFVVVLAMGRIIQMNLRAWEWGRDKSVLQANATEALEWMSRQVRSAHHVTVVSASEFRTYDNGGTLLHTYRRQVVSGVGRLQQDGVNLVDRKCVVFVASPDTATVSVALRLELEDQANNRVEAMTRATVRNRSFTF